MRFFRGRVRDREGSLAYLWIHGRRLGGFVELGAGPDETGLQHRFLFGPRSPRPAGSGTDEHAIAADLGSFAEGAPYCAGEADLPGVPDRLASLPRPGMAPGTLLKASLALDATVEFYAHFGDLEAASAYVASLVGAVSAIYEADLDCQVQLGFLRVFTAEPDPYRSSGVSTSTLLADLRAEWTTNPALLAVPRAVTHLLTVAPGVGGRAYLDVLCNTAFGYGVSAVHGTYTYPAPGYTWDADVVAHELGHNFGSPHTHCYTPEVDRCYNAEGGCYSGPVEPSVGTVMSYCHLVASKVLAFSDPEQQVMRPRIEAAACIEAAGSPGEVAGAGAAALMVVKEKLPQDLVADDGAGNGSSGYTGASQAAWVKRFTPPCAPYRLDAVEIQVNHPSVAAGRPLQMLVYEDPGGSGTPAGSTLVHVQDVTLATVGQPFNALALDAPYTSAGGDLYLGFYDLVNDPEDTFIMVFDTSRTGDSFRKANSTGPSGYGALNGSTFLIRARGACPGIDALRLSWGAPCNDATVPGQDYALYEGTIAGAFDDAASLACGTGKARTHALVTPVDSRFYQVAPLTSVAEGSLGPLTPVPAVTCLPLGPDPCE
jgi:hypothetical protein